jgi:hypothetical protein
MIGLLIPSIFFSLLFLVAIWYAPHKRSGSYFVAYTVGIVFFLGVVTGSLMLVWQAGLTILFVGLFAAYGGGLWGRRLGATAALFGATAIVLLVGAVDARHLAERREALRQEFPLRSISERLAYESAPRRTTNDEGSPTPVLSAEVDRELQAAESHGRYTSRGRSLERLHSGGDEGPGRSLTAWMHSRMEDDLRSMENRSISFTAPQSFGGGCGSGHTPDPLPTPVPQYVPQPSPGVEPLPDYASTAAPPSVEALKEFHRGAGRDFLDPERFGFVRDRDHVAGFQPHAFTNMPKFNSQGASGEWKLERVDLVSLRKPSGPHVYLSENLPRVDALKTADTRLLDDFETRALSRLRSDDDVVVEESEGAVRMLGALRAGNHCTKCHMSARGELIGAFSYEFHRKGRPPVIAQQ